MVFRPTTWSEADELMTLTKESFWKTEVLWIKYLDPSLKSTVRNGEIIQYGLIIYSKTLRERVSRHKLNFRTTRSLNLPTIAKWPTKNGSKMTALIFNEGKIPDINFWSLWCIKNGNWDLIKVRKDLATTFKIINRLKCTQTCSPKIPTSGRLKINIIQINFIFHFTKVRNIFTVAEMDKLIHR